MLPITPNYKQLPGGNTFFYFFVRPRNILLGIGINNRLDKFEYWYVTKLTNNTKNMTAV